MTSLKCHFRGANWDEVWPVLECLHGRLPSKTPGVSHSAGLTTLTESTVNHCPRIQKTASSRITLWPTSDCRVKGFWSTPTEVVCFPEMPDALAKFRSHFLEVHKCMWRGCPCFHSEWIGWGVRRRQLKKKIMAKRFRVRIVSMVVKNLVQPQLV